MIQTVSSWCMVVAVSFGSQFHESDVISHVTFAKNSVLLY
jgi:hypothetical protein